MLELIWTILNILAFCYFIVICFKSTKLIREKLGSFAAIVFVFGLLSFASKSNDIRYETQNFDLKNRRNNATVMNKYNSTIVLENNLLSKISLSVQYNNNDLISAQSLRSGFISGTDWDPTMITVQKTKIKEISNYEVYGTLNWKFLGFQIFT